MLENEMLQLAKRHWPDIIFKTIQFNNDGWDNTVLIINNAIVFRFPKSKDLMRRIADEVVILKQLALKKTILQLPRYTPIYEEKRLIGVTYPFMKGQSLNRKTPPHFCERPENAQAIADFLTKCHSITRSSLKEAHLTTMHTLAYWQQLCASVRDEVFPLLAREQSAEMARIIYKFFQNYSLYSRPKVLIHGDLSASNILYDDDVQQLSGIIDFTDAQYGDPAFDFAGLYWQFGPEFTKNVLSFYTFKTIKDPEEPSIRKTNAKLSSSFSNQSDVSKEDLFTRIQSFYGLQPAFHELVYAVRNKQPIDPAIIQRFMTLSGFVK
ncbi:MAG: aminoglycoside phosphotransferase family protein [Sporolactobacillus sp.]